VRETGKALAGGLQKHLDPVLVGELGAVNLYSEDQAFSIHEKVSLAAADLLASVVPSLFAAYSGRFD
jgi:hypothetical protein